MTTQAYRFPPATPMVPPAHECDRDRLIDLAAAAANSRTELYELLGSGDHVEAICKLVEELSLELAARDRDIGLLQLSLGTAHANTERYRQLHTSSEEEVLRLRRKMISLSEENVTTRHAMAQTAARLHGGRR